MIWILLFSLVFMSVKDTVAAKKRGEPLTLAQSFRANFIKMKNKLRQNLQKQLAWLKRKLGTGPDFLTDY